MKVTTPLLLDNSLLEKLRAKAKAAELSLDSFIESLLLREVEKVPNAETIEAILQARSCEGLEEITDIDQFL